MKKIIYLFLIFIIVPQLVFAEVESKENNDSESEESESEENENEESEEEESEGEKKVKYLSQHEYKIIVLDVDGNPLEGVRMDYEFGSGDTVTKNTSITNSNGELNVNIPAKSYSKFDRFDTLTDILRYSSEYKSELNYIISKDGYCPKSGKLSKTKSDLFYYIALLRQVKPDVLILTRPIDYFNKEFISKLSNVKFKNKIIDFINAIMLEDILSESVIETYSINLLPFKGNNYLSVKFTELNVYNSLRLNKYDIGKQLFDKVVVKILSPLNKYIIESNKLYGYYLIVVGHTKSFIEENATAESIEYKFIIPKKIVRQYKNNDISGQQLLDASIILMDNERIELKLQ